MLNLLCKQTMGVVGLREFDGGKEFVKGGFL